MAMCEDAESANDTMPDLRFCNEKTPRPHRPLFVSVRACLFDHLPVQRQMFLLASHLGSVQGCWGKQAARLRLSIPFQNISVPYNRTGLDI